MSFLKNLFGKKETAQKELGKDTPKAETAAPDAANIPAGNPQDFSHVDSLEKAQALAAEGTLAPLYLFPPELGGAEIPENTVYVPPAIIAVQQQLIGTIKRFAADGLIDNIKVNPEYKGDSFVPAKIHMVTTHGDKAGSFNPTIEIW